MKLRFFIVMIVAIVQVGWESADAAEGISFRKHVIQTISRGTANTAVANDWDGDGHIDVITSFANQVILLRGPDWTPVSLHRFDINATRKPPRAACIHSCVMDVDRDGDLDFIGSNNTVFWLECPDDRPLDQPWAYHNVDDEILGTHCVIVGDVNQDGIDDVIANSFCDETETAFPNSIVWLEVPPLPGTARHWIRHVFADRDAPGGSHYTGMADVNGDGRPDISCGAKGGEGFPGGEWFAWWEQPSDLDDRWRKHVLADAEPGASNIHPVDLNQDGHMDFAATRGHSQGVLWFRGPNFERVSIDPDLVGPHSLVTVDFDGDGDIDLGTCGRDADGMAVWYENDGDANFTKHLIGRDQGSYDMRAIDMDFDGDLDWLIAGHASRNLVWFESVVGGADE